MTKPTKKPRGADTLDLMLGTERLAIAMWLEERVAEMRPDRSTIREEYGCDLVMLLDSLAKSILRELNERLDLTMKAKKKASK